MTVMNMAYPCVAWVPPKGGRGVKGVAGEEAQSGGEYARIVVKDDSQ